MGWLQNAFHATGRRAAWALRSPFWGRYKGILIEPGNCFWALFDYIHLNPVRAGIIAEKVLQSLYDGSKWKKR
jgi:putative transposase